MISVKDEVRKLAEQLPDSATWDEVMYEVYVRQKIADGEQAIAEAGMTADQLAAQFDLDLAQVHAALSYYYLHKVAVDAEIRANSDQAELWRQRLVEQGRCATV